MNKSQKKFVFVLMPFDELFNDIYSYGIKQTCIELDAYCERVDEQIFNERILDRIYNQIAKADIIIADMTSRNANVFYEVGFAHGIGKNVILLTKNSEDIPFDLKHFPHIIYDGKIKELSTQLKKKLDWFLKEDNIEVLQDIDFNFDFLIDGNKIVENTVLDISEIGLIQYPNSHNLKIDIYNNSPRIYKTKFSIGFELSNDYESMFGNLEKIKPSKESVLYVSKEISSIYPNAFKSVDFDFNLPTTDNSEERVIDVKLMIFTAFESKTINFKIKFKTKSIW